MDTQNSTVPTLELEPEPVTPTRIQPPQPTTNGVLKRHPRVHIHHPRHPVVVMYKECLKNHAAHNGGHSIDGCGEFLPAPTSNPSRPQTLYCDVCGCHRNFHRRDEEYYFSLPLLSRNRHVHIANESVQAPPPAIPALAPDMVMASNPNNAGGVSRKRFRTKFTQDQKGKMLDLAEKVGWKMQKRNEGVINESCLEIGVEKGVFKVWMHNNKNTIGKKGTSDNPIAAAAVVTPMVNNNNGNLGNGDKNEENNGNGEEKGVNNGSSSAAAAASELLI